MYALVDLSEICSATVPGNLQYFFQPILYAYV